MTSLSIEKRKRGARHCALMRFVLGVILSMVRSKSIGWASDVMITVTTFRRDNCFGQNESRKQRVINHQHSSEKFTHPRAWNNVTNKMSDACNVQIWGYDPARVAGDRSGVCETRSHAVCIQVPSRHSSPRKEISAC